MDFGEVDVVSHVAPVSDSFSQGLTVTLGKGLTFPVPLVGQVCGRGVLERLSDVTDTLVESGRGETRA